MPAFLVCAAGGISRASVFGSEAVNASGEAVTGLVKSRVTGGLWRLCHSFAYESRQLRRLAFCAIIILGSDMEYTCISVDSGVMMDFYPVHTKKSNKFKSGFKKLNLSCSYQAHQVITCLIKTSW